MPKYKYGDNGKCHTYIPENVALKNVAYNKAIKQGRAIRVSGYE